MALKVTDSLPKIIYLDLTPTAKQFWSFRGALHSALSTSSLTFLNPISKRWIGWI
jgi:hypothetical protein